MERSKRSEGDRIVTDPIGRADFPLSLIVTARVITVFLIVASLKIGETLLIPIALSLLMAFLLSPAVGGLEKRRVPRYPAAIGVVLITLTCCVAFGWFAVSETASLWADTPKFRNNISAKFSHLATDVKSTLRRFEKAISLGARPVAVNRPSAIVAEDGTSILVTPPSHDDDLSMPSAATPIVVLSSLGLAAAETIVMLAVVAVLSVFLLVHRDEARERLLGLFGGSRLIMTTQILGDAAHGVRRYLLLYLFVNVIYGTLLGLALVLLGIPSAFLWAGIAVCFRFVPHIGVYLALVPPVICALALDNAWTTALLVVALGVALDAAMSNFVEPHVYGRRIGVSSIALVLSALFWTWCWGVFGLLLATPFSVLLAVLGRYVPGLEPIAILFGESSGLHPSQRFYHELLSGNASGAEKLFRETLGTRGRQFALEELLIPAMIYAEADRERQLLSDNLYRRIVAAAATITDEKLEGDEAAVEVPQSSWSAAILPIRTEAESTVSAVLGRLLESEGHEAHRLSERMLPAEVASAIEKQAAHALVIVALTTHSTARLQYLLKKLAVVNVPVIVFSPGVERSEWKLRSARLSERSATFVQDFSAISVAAASLSLTSSNERVHTAQSA